MVKQIIRSILLLWTAWLLVSCGYTEKGADGHYFESRNGKAIYAGENKAYTGWMHIKEGGFMLNGYYKDGKRHGTWKYWFENGQMQRIEHYKDGRLHGVKKEWHSDGSIKFKMKYRDGNKVDS